MADNSDQKKCRPKLRPTESIICDLDGSEPLHELSTFKANRFLYEMATEMGDRDLLIKFQAEI